MKTLILVRHAKSSWENHHLSDHERPLNNRGLRDAPNMGGLLRDRGVKPDVMISSSAVRARTTAAILADEIEFPEQEITILPELYGASVGSALREVIQTIDKSVDTAMLFGHNPTFNWLTNELSGVDIDNVPTCGIVTISFDTQSWKKVDRGNGRMLAFDYPKKYFY